MQQRKRHADHDALLLQNRINLLRKEEAKVRHSSNSKALRAACLLSVARVSATAVRRCGEPAKNHIT